MALAAKAVRSLLPPQVAAWRFKPALRVACVSSAQCRALPSHAPAAPSMCSIRQGRQGWRGVRAMSSTGQIVDQVLSDLGGESITEGTLMEMKKKVGEAVAKDEVIATIETDKVTIEVKAIESGVLKEVFAKVDDNVEKGQVLAKIEVGAAGAAPAGAPASAARPAAAAAAPTGKIVEQSIEDFGGESITEGTIMEWKKQVGDFAQKGDLLAVIETDKVTIEVKAEVSGTIREILAKADETVQKGAKLVKIQEGGAPAGGASPAAVPAAAAPTAPVAEHSDLHGLRLTFARLAAKRLGLPVPGEAAAPAPKAAAAPGKVASSQPQPVSVGEGKIERRVPLSFVRKRVVSRLKETQNTAALLSTFQEIDMTEAIALRTRYKDSFLKLHGSQLGLLSMITKASCLALAEVPGVNAVIDDATKETVWRDYMDISIPIPSPRGVISCTIRDAQNMSIRDLEHEIAGFADRARSDSLAVSDISDPTFGIVDAGISGGMLGTGMINFPQSAAMGTNAIKQRPAAIGGKVVARPFMYVSLTYDHRLVDGREAVTFLCSVRDKLQDPARMLLDL
eukprot:TRINITY_DN87118_c0_g1_i1.p1 TRINITY_DN87118_c0_g1~~TRINITY_DN87118_c0_g1_i1.p1  ORF type:complete len:580 (+),score=136.56 TRINITY_DN87118_c0_g1_i1:43-1740(+)